MKVTRHTAGSEDLVPLVQILDGPVRKWWTAVGYVQIFGQPDGRAGCRSAQDSLIRPALVVRFSVSRGWWNSWWKSADCLDQFLPPAAE